MGASVAGGQNPVMAAQLQQQRLLHQQQQQQRALMASGLYGNMAQGMPMGMHHMNMNAAQFAAMRNNPNMRGAVGIPPHLHQAHLAQQAQHQGGNPQQAQVSFHVGVSSSVSHGLMATRTDPCSATCHAASGATASSAAGATAKSE